MKECFVVASSIQTSNVPLTYSRTRTLFGAEERYRQTIYTINSIISQKPEATIFIVDSSSEYPEYMDNFQYFPNTTLIRLKDISPQIQQDVNTHPHKSHAECLLLNTFFEAFKKEMKEFDFIYKATGRYVYNMNNFKGDAEKIYFKFPNQFIWDSSWNEYYKLVDNRISESHNFFRQYCTVLYGFGSQHLHKMVDIWTAVSHIVTKQNYTQYDVECLTYHYMQTHKSLLEHVNWTVTGFDGTSGRLMYY